MIVRLKAALILFPLFFVAAASAQDLSYLTELKQQAKEMQLSDQRLWRILLHYNAGNWPGSIRSLADDPTFFNSPTGKTDPQAELAATLESFFKGPEVTIAGQHPQCRFIARYNWLKQALSFDPSRLPKQQCPDFDEWFTALDPQGVTLVFPAAYLNSPASMFGHTLLRIDARGQNEETRLLAYAASYGAMTEDDNGVAFAIKGLFGGYLGGFAVEPYYKRVKTYNDLEHRDIWEYELNLSSRETTLLLYHLWELGYTKLDYYFFDENCASQLLALIEAARPELDLTSGFGWWAIPSDTVRAVVDTPDLVRKITYRPSAVTRLQWRLDEMPGEQQNLSLDLVEKRVALNEPKLEQLSLEEKASVFELAFDYLNYLRLAGKDPAGANDEFARDLLLARSKLGVMPSEPAEKTPVRPDQGHETARLAIGAGWDDEKPLYEFSGRPAYHDLLDNQAGYVPGAQIDFGALTVRQEEGDHFRIERFLPIDIISLAPRNRFIHPISWRIGAGIERKHISEDSSRYAGFLKGGPGLTYALLERRLFVAGLAVADVQYSPDYEESGFSTGSGPSFGIYADLTDRLRSALTAEALRFFAGEIHDEANLAFAQRFSLTPSWSLGASVSRINQFGNYRNQFMVSLIRYF